MSSPSTSPASSSSSISSTITNSANAPTDSFAILFHIVPVSAVCTFLHTNDVLVVSSVNHATRRLVLSSPAVWRNKVFSSFSPSQPVSAPTAAPPPSQPTTHSPFQQSWWRAAVSSFFFRPTPPPALPPTRPTAAPPPPSPPTVSRPSTLPSWSSVVQVVDAKEMRGASTPSDWPVSFADLVRYPNLRRVHTSNHVLTQYGRGSRGDRDASSIAPCPNLSSMRHLTSVSLFMGGEVSIEDMRLLATLPALASFSGSWMSFEHGSEDTLRQWQALIVHRQRRTGKRKADQLAKGEGEDEEDGDWEEAAEEVVSSGQKKDADGEDGEENEGAEDDEGEEDGDDPSQRQKYSALLLFLHALASKPSFVHLELSGCDITPFVLDHMPILPHLLSLDLHGNDDPNRYHFKHIASRFPSLTSLTSPNCSDAAIAQLVRLPALEELRFPEYLTTEEGGGRVLTSDRGFHSLSKAAKLRAIYFTPPEGADEYFPSLEDPTTVLAFVNLTRITISAFWPIDSLLTHHFQHLRCLELVQQYGCGYYFCPQSDELLLPLVKPLNQVVVGREQRQAVRAAERYNGGRDRPRDTQDDGNSDDKEAQEDEADPAIPIDNAANFPSLECLALPYGYYNRGWGDDCGVVSRWIQQQLRRSYEYEVAEEWEAECTTLGSAELLKSIRA